MNRIKTNVNYCSSGSGQNSLIPVVCDVPEHINCTYNMYTIKLATNQLSFMIRVTSTCDK